MANKSKSSSSSKSKTTTKSKTTKKVNSYVSTKPTVVPAKYNVYTAKADTYDGPTYEAQQYASNYNPTEYTDAYTPGQYQSKYLPQIEQRVNDVANWKYDPLQDASYQALAAVYGARGNQAAKNSLADAASLNGGYGTSYAVSAAQQARNQYNQELAAMIPELEQNAYNRAQSGLSALMDLDNSMYGRFSDDESRQLAAKQYGLDVAGFNEGNKQFAEQNAQNIFSMNNDERYRAVQNAMDVYGINNANKQWAKEYNQSERQFKFNAGMDRADLLNNYYQWATGYNSDLYKWNLAQQEAKSSGSGGGGGRSGGGGGYSGGGSSTPTGNGTPTYDDTRVSLIQSSGNNKANNKLISANNLETVKYKNKKGGGRVIK